MEKNETHLEAQDLNQQGAMLLKAGKWEEARAKFDRAIELDPMLMDSYKNYGDLHMELEEYQDAKNSYKKAMLIEKNGLLYFLYGNACFMNDEPEEGIENYNIAITEGYDSDEMMYFMGMAYEHMNDDGMALRYYQKACAKNPAKPDYQVKKIVCMLRLEMYDSAEESTEELLRTAPELYDGYHIKTLLLAEQGKTKEAVDFAKAASEKFPEDADLMYDYARSAALNADMDEALALIERAKKMKYFDSAKRQFTLLEAQIFADEAKIPQAVECCKRCVEMEDGEVDGEARFMLMNLLLGQEDFQGALEQAKQLVKADREDVYYYAALYYRAFCTRRLGREEEARKLYREANAFYRMATLKRPDAVDAYLYRAMCLKDLEEYDKALEMADFLLGLNRDLAEVHILKAGILKEQGRKALAEEELQKAYQLKPELKPQPEQSEQS